MTTQDLDLNADILDVCNVITRVEELEKQVPDNDNEFRVWEHAVEFDTLVEILEDLKGKGNDKQWRGDWYPATLIHFEDFDPVVRYEAYFDAEEAEYCVAWITKSGAIDYCDTFSNIEEVPGFLDNSSTLVWVKK